MTDEELAKRLAELGDEFHDMCTSRDCYGCEMEAFSVEGVCSSAWVWKRMKEEEDAGARLMPNQEEGALPAWCKVGQWVFHNGCLLGKIEGFEEDFNDGSAHPTTYVVLRSHDTHNKLPFTRLPKQIQPVRFRAYTYEEAKGLIGKELEYTSCHDKCNHIEMITAVCESTNGFLLNGMRHEFWADRDTTIDGIPVGVPEVDEEAMKGGEE